MALDLRPIRVIKNEKTRLRVTQSDPIVHERRLEAPKRSAVSLQEPLLEYTPVVTKSYTDSIATALDPDAGNTPAKHLLGVTQCNMDSLYDVVVHDSHPFDVSTILNVISDPTSESTLVKYNSESHKWVDWPDTNKLGIETELCDYLNKIAETVRGILGLQRGETDLVFSAEYQSTGHEAGDNTVIKPDIIVIPRKLKGQEPADWFDFRSFGSHRIGTECLKTESERITEFASCCFIGRPGRNYVVGFEFLHNDLSFYVFDRSGIMATPYYNVDEHPEVLLNFAISILFMSETQLGYDTSLSLLGNNPTIKAGEKTYSILQCLHVDQTLQGRGTVCFKVEDEDGKVFVTKDAWVDGAKSTTEAEILKILKDSGMKNVPTLVSSEIVPGGTTRKDSSESFRMQKIVKELNGSDRAESLAMFHNVEIRDHYRLVQEPYGESFNSFRTLQELLSGTLDILTAIDALDRIGIVHRDISINNIILVSKPPFRYRKGYIIDFDNAIKKVGCEVAVPERIGTLQFMAFAILRKEAIHSSVHDAESLLYILIWIAINQQGPCYAKRLDFDARKTILRLWSPAENADERTLVLCSQAKECVMVLSSRFERDVIRAMHSYFRPLHKCFKRIRRALFPPEPIDEDGEVLEIIVRDHHEVLEEAKAIVASSLDGLEREEAEANVVTRGSLAPAKYDQSQLSVEVRSGPDSQVPSSYGDILAATKSTARPTIYHSRYYQGLKLPRVVETPTEADGNVHSQVIPSPKSPAPRSSCTKGVPTVTSTMASSSTQALRKRSRDLSGSISYDHNVTKKPKAWDKQRENIGVGDNDQSQFSSLL